MGRRRPATSPAPRRCTPARQSIAVTYTGGVERPAARSQRRGRRHRPRPLALLGARRQQRRPDSASRGRQSPHRRHGASRRHAGRQHVDAVRCAARRPRHDARSRYIYWFNNTAGAQPTFSLDDVALRRQRPADADPARPGAGPGAAASMPPPAATRSARYIYGMNFADEALAAELRLPVRRWGGNATTRYNWQHRHLATTPPTGTSRTFPTTTRTRRRCPTARAAISSSSRTCATGTETLLTVPLIGWTPRGRAYGCGFSVAKYGAQQSTDP